VTDLDRIGTRYKKLLAEQEALKPSLKEAMRAERAKGMTQEEIATKSGYSIQQVRNITADVKPER
jgi:hypothetical protein